MSGYTHVPVIPLSRDRRCCHLWQTFLPSATRYSARRLDISNRLGDLLEREEKKVRLRHTSREITKSKGCKHSTQKIVSLAMCLWLAFPGRLMVTTAACIYW